MFCLTRRSIRIRQWSLGDVAGSLPKQSSFESLSATQNLDALDNQKRCYQPAAHRPEGCHENGTIVAVSVTKFSVKMTPPSARFSAVERPRMYRTVTIVQGEASARPHPPGAVNAKSSPFLTYSKPRTCPHGLRSHSSSVKRALSLEKSFFDTSTASTCKKPCSFELGR